MRRNENFILRRVGDMTVLMPVGPAARQFPGMVSVNETGAFLWELLAREQTLPALGQALAEAYDTTPAAGEADAAAFLERLRPTGAVDGL